LFAIRRQLSGLASRLLEITFPGGSAKFGKQLEEAREQFEQIKLPAPSDKPTDSGERNLQYDLAQNFPEAFVILAYKDVEEPLMEIRRRMPPGTPQRNHTEVLNYLQEKKFIDPHVVQLFQNLRAARNTAVHAKGRGAITPAEAVDYGEQARGLSELFRQVLERVPPRGKLTKKPPE
jgi:hypothetical protein